MTDFDVIVVGAGAGGLTAAAVAAAATQEAQTAALIAPWAGGNVTVKVRGASGLLSTCVHGPWTLNNGVTPRAAVLDALTVATDSSEDVALKTLNFSRSASLSMASRKPDTELFSEP